MPPTPRTPRTPAKRDVNQPDPTFLALFSQLKHDFESGLPVELAGCDRAPDGVRAFRGVDVWTSQGRQESLRILCRDDQDGEAPEFWVAKASGKSKPGSSKVGSAAVKQRGHESGSDIDDEAPSTSGSSSEELERTPSRRRVVKYAGSSSPRTPKAGAPPSSPSKGRRRSHIGSSNAMREPDPESDEGEPRAGPA